MTKSLKDLLLGPENQGLAHKAVKAAVARADAAGLVPAFEPYVSLSKNLPKEELLAMRCQVLKDQAKRGQDEVELRQ